MQRTPIERLRNILSPLMTLVGILEEEHTIEFTNPGISNLYNDVLKTSIENRNEIHRHLTVADNVMLSLDECEHIINSLSATYDEAVKILEDRNISDAQRKILENKKQRSLQLKVKLLNFASLTK